MHSWDAAAGQMLAEWHDPPADEARLVRYREALANAWQARQVVVDQYRADVAKRQAKVRDFEENVSIWRDYLAEFGWERADSPLASSLGQSVPIASVLVGIGVLVYEYLAGRPFDYVIWLSLGGAFVGALLLGPILGLVLWRLHIRPISWVARKIWNVANRHEIADAERGLGGAAEAQRQLQEIIGQDPLDPRWDGAKTKQPLPTVAGGTSPPGLSAADLRELCVRIPIEIHEGVHVGYLNDERIMKCQHFVLGAVSSMPADFLGRELAGRAKIASWTQLPFLMRAATRGVPLQVTHRPPPEIPVRPGVVYFTMDISVEHWRHIIAERKVAIYAPPPFDPSQVSIELYGILT